MARVQLEQIDIARRVIARYPKDLQWSLTAADVRAAQKAGKIGFAAGHGRRARHREFAGRPAALQLITRYVTLTHNVTLDWADAANNVPKHNGLTSFGKEVVREMNRLGMLVDLSHVSPAVMSNALDVSEAPVIFSHSAARGLTDVPRNVPDSILARLPRNGGVVMMTFVPGFTSQAVADYSNRVIQEGAAVVCRDTVALEALHDRYAEVRKSAGSDATTTTPTPTAKLMATVGQCTSNGASNPKLRRANVRPTTFATRMPSPAPTPAPIAPIRADVVRKERNTVPRVAPIAFIIAISWLCSETIVFMVLAMRKRLTNRIVNASTAMKLMICEKISRPSQNPSSRTSAKFEGHDRRVGNQVVADDLHGLVHHVLIGVLQGEVQVREPGPRR